ncbi:MAG: precorrin-2 dehydrogenase/sirohydrochlorin ferrochelatase family protein [Candidatus Marinarcus sp.]|uniref:precorrin-2 dehydrogenase/sirohydrochlorin ferrochelatase family protein n=1 Tax=Candidatus Marinarcus sp. TaxID=3100987 RepID=UPI003AFFE27B
MAYFPAFLKFDDKKILIIGGGSVALEKLEHLLDFTKNITLIAQEFNAQTQKLIQEHQLRQLKKAYEKNDIEGFDIVIAAIDNFVLQEQIYFETRGKNCLCNCVDLQKYCDFIFPSYVKKGDLTIAISTGGASPAVAKQLRIYFSKLIPDSMIEFLLQMKQYRKTMPKGKERMQFLDKKAQDYIQNWQKK